MVSRILQPHPGSVDGEALHRRARQISARVSRNPDLRAVADWIPSFPTVRTQSPQRAAGSCRWRSTPRVLLRYRVNTVASPSQVSSHVVTEPGAGVAGEPFGELAFTDTPAAFITGLPSSES